ncbi:MAG: DUF389 domain-containing protein [Rhodospirillales bacterium]|nr:DUF389 domain-containing protein [Rhodospirillales bacterium]
MNDEGANSPGPAASGLAAEVTRNFTVMLRALRRLLLRRLPVEEAQDVRRQVDADGAFSERYALMCALSAGIATLGLLQSSSAVVIGAMLVSPLMAPIAKLGFSFASFDARRAQAAARVLAIGAAIGIALGMILTWLSPIRNATPEIIARTAPTLLDLAVAVLSGLAGGYATVHRRGETAIGVAIATALMPPLATVGYSLAVARWDFAAGASLLFLTNLAAIAFSFALVARVRGVVRPIEKVEFKPLHVALGVVAFLALATPLALTLRRVTLETRASLAARQEIARIFEIDPNQVVQLSVSWANLDVPHVTATAITPNFLDDAERSVTDRLTQRLHAQVDLQLQQIVARDQRMETQAVIEAAIAQGRLAGAPASVSPRTDPVVRASRLRVAQAWLDAEDQEIRLLLAPQATSLAAMRAEEVRLNTLGFGWTVRIVPPYRERLPVLFPDDRASISAETEPQMGAVVWALQRWGVSSVVVEGISGANPSSTRSSRVLSEARASAVAAFLVSNGLQAQTRIASRETASSLAEQGVARVRAADILPFEINEGGGQ